MPIDEKTAQLILDAISWCNHNWLDDLGWEREETTELAIARSEFKQFCNARGITEVIRVVRQ